MWWAKIDLKNGLSTKKSTQKWISTLRKQGTYQNLLICVMIYYQFFVAKGKIKKNNFIDHIFHNKRIFLIKLSVICKYVSSKNNATFWSKMVSLDSLIKVKKVLRKFKY